MSNTASTASDRLEVRQEKAPVPLGLFKVRFKNEDPCRPRYEDLYRYHSAEEKENQIEPAFQIANTVEAVSIIFALDSSEMEFVPEDKVSSPLCREMGEKAPSPDLKVDYHEGDKSRCVLTWNTPREPAVKVFRIYCRRKQGEFTKEHKVHGGIFVVFSTYSTGTMGKQILPPDHQHEDHHEVHLLGTDQHHRPLYDIHQAVQVPKTIEIEPAYRIRRTQKVLSFRMNMKIKKAQWEDKVIFPQPGGKPAELTHELTGAAKDSFRFQWTVKNPTDSGKVTTFHLVPKLADDALTQPLPAELAEWETWENYAEALKEIGIDPTVVQPPRCDDIFQVCIAYDADDAVSV